MDTLHDKGLVEYNLGRRGMMYEAASAMHLQLSLIKKREELAQVETAYQGLVEELFRLQAVAEQVPKTVYYEGVTGLLSAARNTLEARNEGLRIYELSDLSAYLEQNAAAEIRRGLTRNKVITRLLINTDKFGPWTDSEESVQDWWQVRYLSPKILKISYQIAIYNNIVAMFTVREKIPYCVEIHDGQLANMHRQLFDLAWIQAREMTATSDHGWIKVSEDDGVKP